MDMDEDEKEMLSEARARLANTKCALLPLHGKEFAHTLIEDMTIQDRADISWCNTRCQQNGLPRIFVPFTDNQICKTASTSYE